MDIVDCSPVEFRDDRPGITYVYFEDELYGLIRCWRNTMIGDTLKPYSFTPKLGKMKNLNFATLEEAEEFAMTYVEAVFVAGAGHWEDEE